MPTRIAALGCVLAALALILCAQPASASTHLLIPRFTSLPEDNTYIEVNNGNDYEAWFELRAFSSTGEPLGVARMPVDPHAATVVSLRDAFGFGERPATGWIDAFSSDDVVGLTLHPDSRNGLV